MGPSRSLSLGDGECSPAPPGAAAGCVGGVGALAAGPQAPASVSAYSPSFSSSATSGRGPDLSPLTRRVSPGGRSPQTPSSRPLGVGNPSLSSLRAPCRDPVWPRTCPRNGVWYCLGSPGGAFRPLPTLGSRLGPQAPPPRAPWSLILAQPGVPPAPRVFPSPPSAAVTGNGAQIFGTPGVGKGRERGPQGPACFVVRTEPLQPGGGARPS